MGKSMAACMSEKEIHALICRTFSQGGKVVVGPGDDCAVLDFGGGKLFLIAVDQLVSDVHYASGKTTPAEAAAKLLKRNLSDIAAMGGMPSFALLTIAARRADRRWITGFIKALQREASKWNVSICGGDISSLKKDATVCTLTIGGEVEKDKLCLRSNAKPGDILYATGEYGNSFKSGHHLKFVPRIEAARFIAGKYSRCMMDVSDGLLADAERICGASKVSLELDKGAIPLRKGAGLRSALSEGEDYELIFAVPPAKSAGLEKAWPFRKIRLSRIGRFVPGPKARISGKDGRQLQEKRMGYEHFKT